MTAIIPVTGSTYHPRTPTPLTNLIHLRLGETTHREKPLSHDLLAKLVRHITIGKPRRAESATSDRHSRVCQSPFPSLASPPSPAGATCLPPPPRSRFSLPSSLSLSLTTPDPLPPCQRPVFPSNLLRGACLAPQNKRKTTDARTATTRGGDATADPVTGDHYSSTTQGTTPRLRLLPITITKGHRITGP